KLRHMFTSPLNMYLRDRERPKGAMRPMPNLMETELETFGASTVEDFTWKQLLDTDACTVCGRCTSVCPAHATGKPLDPREIVLKIGNVMAATGPDGTSVSPVVGEDPELTVSADSVFERITAEEVWACTSCKACDEICPVDIEILDKILDMRRYLSLMESNFPTELGTAYRAMENQSNPWGMNQGERADWAKGLPDEVAIVDSSSPFAHEFLYWVDCAGSFDDKNKKVSQAMAKLMHRAGVDFAILGPSELCTGDPARRSGNEYIFQMLAIQNVEAPRSSTRGMCCGGGGARMWMEESVGKKVNTERSQELIATGAGRIAVACPYCYIMIDDGVKENGRDDVLVQDISIHLLDAIEGEHAASEQPASHPGTDLHQPTPSDEPAAT